MGDAAEDAERRAMQEAEEEGITTRGGVLATKTKEKEVPVPTPEEAERAAMDKQPEPPGTEVTAEDLTRGIDQPVWESTLPAEVVAELRKPLDPNRVRRRSGRGGTQFEYLAGHDVKRRANEIFGFGNWGAEIVELTELASVPVSSREGKEGWHVAYSCIVRVSVRGCLPVSDVGYGDGVEYGPAAHATARELAVKESSTDAMKRALTQFGDQFGLILYAKKDEVQRIDRERNRDDTEGSRHTPVRTPKPTVPTTWAQVTQWASGYGDDLGWPVWIAQAALALFGVDDSRALTQQQRVTLLQKASGAIVALREAHDDTTFPPPTRAEVQEAWAKVMDGFVLDGPEWRMDPSEEDRPVRVTDEVAAT